MLLSLFLAGLALSLLSCSKQDQAPVSGPIAGDLSLARAWWLAADTVAWDVPPDSRVRLHFSADARLEISAAGLRGGESIELTRAGSVAGALAEKYPHLAGLPAYRVGKNDLQRVSGMLKTQFAVAAVDPGGALLDASALQPAGVLDELFSYNGALGVSFEGQVPTIRLWAPTARSVSLHLFDGSDPGARPAAVLPMQADPLGGTWSVTGEPSWDRKFYLYEVEVYVRSTGRIERNLVTDPWSVSLSMDSRRSQIVKLSDADLKPAGWDDLDKPALARPEDIVLYELHVRDFSVADLSVPGGQRGTFAAFTQGDSQGVRHLRGLSGAGLTHLHLLPAFDCATIPENREDRLEVPDLAVHAGDSESQQAEIGKVRARDAFNWCYDPYHYTVPEGSYATNPDDVTRVREFREMVAALNRNGLRVVMDVVYNHSSASGQADTSVLDKIVPDYYQRLDAEGRVETSTCCANTATEHNMMEKLMLDSLLTWAVQYKVDGFRFDLMGHHSRANIEKARDALQALTPQEHGVDGSSIYLYGEGWNFGEVADDARFIQATQANMGQGTGIGTFNDRIRDAVRGGEHNDAGILHVQHQGFVNGLYYDPNTENSGSMEEKEKLLQLADLLRTGLAGGLAGYRLVDRHGNEVAAREIDYHGQAAAYASDPQETINYVAAHDNETLFDINQYKLPPGTSLADRVRVINLANSLVALAQGIPFFHAGQDMLRSKSLDRNSFDSGDWFNLLDFSYQENGWARGLPPKWDNEANWPVAGPLLADPELAPGPEEIESARVHLEELLRIRKSSGLFRLSTAQDVKDRLAFHNTGPAQVPGLVVMSLLGGDGERVVVLFNASASEQVFPYSGEGGFVLHPVQQESRDEVVRTAKFDETRGVFSVPARTTAVFIGLSESAKQLH
jgi:pullulanase-type alpha-1,6-glucosidase